MSTHLDIMAARYQTSGGGHWHLELQLRDGRRLTVPAEQKETPFKHGALRLFGDGAEEEFSWSLPADTADGRAQDQDLPGYVRDPRLFALFLQFIRDLNQPEMSEREVAIPARR